MSFDLMYDEMLHEEFSARGKHEAKAAFQRIVAAVEAEPELAQSTSRGHHAAAEEPAEETAEEPAERLSGFQRYRTAALVGAGGLACAAAGAFLGGLGGYFTISPAAAHPVASSTVTQDLPLAQAVGQSGHTSSGGALGTSAVEAADFSKVSGALTQGIAPFATLTSDPLANLPVTGVAGLFGGASGGTGTGSIGSGTVTGGSDNTGTGSGLTGCSTSSSDLGLSCILSGLTNTLSNLGSLSGSNPAGTLDGLSSLDGVVSDVTGTLQNLSSLLPIASLPLPTSGLPTSVLAGTSGTSDPVTGILGTTGIGSGSSNPVVSALAPVLGTVGSLTSGLGSTAPSIPSLPLSSSSGSTLPSLPLSSSTGSSTTSTGSAPTGSGSSNTINVPLSVPLPVSTPTITIGGLSVGINSSGSNSGLTLTLP